MRGLWRLVGGLALTGLSCGPRPPLETPQAPLALEGPVTMTFPLSMDGANTLLCFETESRDACVELRTIRLFARSLERCDQSSPAGPREGASEPLRGGVK